MLNDETDNIGMIDYAWSHAIISDQLHHGIIKECDFTKENQTRDCKFKFRGFLEAFSDIDIYSIYSPICLTDYHRSLSPKLLVAPRFLAPHVSLFPHLSSSICYHIIISVSSNIKDNHIL